MSRHFLFIVFTWMYVSASFAQSVHGDREKEWMAWYRETPEKKFELRHTKLKVSFDFSKQYMPGEAWITLKPFFYPQNTLRLDAKAMLIHEVKQDGKALTHKYDGAFLDVDLGKTYTRNDSLTLYIRYTARPGEVKSKGSAAITDARGLYFIDPLDTEPDKPTQIWTQGETESSSCWFPTLDAPNQKTSQEIYMTVPDRFVTLSNGLMDSSVKNADGTRTDYWNFPMPHAPYLFFMAVGEFEIVKDVWKKMPVDYYVEKKYAPYAKEIFGHTPEMIQFFSDLTGITYPWPKYAQVVCRDYVSGAMENTTAVIHAENAHQTDRQLADGNDWEDVIAHELFHHWFGDYVTCESWSNLTVNESFATYSEYLWREYKYGRDHADEHLLGDWMGYNTPENYEKNLVRYFYEDKEDMFDGVSYAKGGVILHFLRSELGDEAFFAGLNRYLSENRYGAAEAHQLRLALEEVSGRDLNPFFNQWFFGNGHPKLNITYSYSNLPSGKQVEVKVEQTTPEKLFSFPITFDVYEKGGKKSHRVWVEKESELFTFPVDAEPLLVNADALRVLPAEITENKSTANYIFQLLNCPRYLDRKQALDYLLQNKKEKGVEEALVKALDDPYKGIRIDVLSGADFSEKSLRKAALPKLEKMAKEEKDNVARGLVLEVLAGMDNKAYLPLFTEAVKAKSYGLCAAGLIGLYSLDKPSALTFMKNLDKKEVSGRLRSIMTKIFVNEEDTSGLEFIASFAIEHLFMERDENQEILKKGFDWVIKSDHESANRALLDNMADLGIRYKQYGILPFMQMEVGKIKTEKEKMASKNPTSESLKRQVEYANLIQKKLTDSK